MIKKAGAVKGKILVFGQNALKRMLKGANPTKAMMNFGYKKQKASG